MAKKSKSPHRLNGEILTIRRGVAIYRTYASPYWNARIRDRANGKYLVRSTKETSRLKARTVAEELAVATAAAKPIIDPAHLFDTYAQRFIQRATALVAKGERNKNYVRTGSLCLEHPQWGLLSHFGGTDIRQVQTRDYMTFMDGLSKSRPDLSLSTLNMLSATLRNVLKVARHAGVIDHIPETPRVRQKDKPRPFFRFHPLVAKNKDAYQKLLATAKEMAAQKVAVKKAGVITTELYDLILFVAHSFVRPTTTELYALRHEDIAVADNPRRLLVTVRKGKTGARIANTMQAAVSVFERVRKRYPNAKSDDYLFLPQYLERQTAARRIARQFNAVLAKAGIKQDPFTKTDHSVYSLRHTSICMRIILSHGKVNIFNLAKNAGTSVEQIERFYAKNLPLSSEMAKNLQVFGTP